MQNIYLRFKKLQFDRGILFTYYPPQDNFRLYFNESVIQTESSLKNAADHPILIRIKFVPKEYQKIF